MKAREGQTSLAFLKGNLWQQKKTTKNLKTAKKVMKPKEVVEEGVITES